MKHSTKLLWERKSGEQFTDLKYSRAHKWSFDCGIQIAASSSPSVVPVPYSDESAVDPEEAFTAALSSCHMLSFLAVAARKEFVVDSYEDEAQYAMARNADGVLVVESVTLRPSVRFSGFPLPTPDGISEMHEIAHRECFLANSVKTKVAIANE